jgi:hypothetical protein
MSHWTGYDVSEGRITSRAIARIFRARQVELERREQSFHRRVLKRATRFLQRLFTKQFLERLFTHWRIS